MFPIIAMTCAVQRMITYAVASGANCRTVMTATTWFEALPTILNSLLFLIRIRGVFFTSRWITIVFSLLWLSTFSAIISPLRADLRVSGIVPIRHIGDMKPWISTGLITVAIFDTAVFVAISIRLLHYGMAKIWRERLRSFVNGQGMGMLARALLQTGQLYYL